MTAVYVRRTTFSRFWDNAQGRLGMLLLFALAATFIVLPVALGGDPLHIDYTTKLKPPSLAHPAGTDQFGRDQLLRFLHGGRISLLMSALILGLSITAGIAVGLVAALNKGPVGSLLMRLVDMLLSMPQLVVALTLVAVLGIGTTSLIVAIAASIWPIFARMAYGLASQALLRPDVLAARMAGLRKSRVVIGHVLPCVFSEVIAVGAYYYAEILGTVAGLSFVGLGIQPPSPEWGSMLSEARPYFSVAPWLIYVPVAGLALVTIATAAVASSVRTSIGPIYQGQSDAKGAMR